MLYVATQSESSRQPGSTEPAGGATFARSVPVAAAVLPPERAVPVAPAEELRSAPLGHPAVITSNNSGTSGPNRESLLLMVTHAL
jgi:hypothetical protein